MAVKSRALSCLQQGKEAALAGARPIFCPRGHVCGLQTIGVTGHLRPPAPPSLCFFTEEGADRRAEPGSPRLLLSTDVALSEVWLVQDGRGPLSGHGGGWGQQLLFCCVRSRGGSLEELRFQQRLCAHRGGSGKRKEQEKRC